MRAAVYFKHGKPEDVLQAVDVEDPKHPEHNKVLIRVLLRPVHHGDLLDIAGRSIARRRSMITAGQNGPRYLSEKGATKDRAY
ncbi:MULTISPECIES: hypothetical protein [Rhizobium/Agrobacterium group]|uniref:hypothetical protein n=1 Tax=Rhizobium/Agrobacterium group TaxID=227290 RepID=UPI0003F21719|nr:MULTISPECIES: hypothetical protein [Rhizobium/Agrobacterium group]AHK04766.1 nuclear receptor binding factor related protein [Agrobacterium tumefaciens LBA4213 (Ach5)]AKC10498.1 zinc-binding dehydrogenase [Agrobacterium tumefaciens]AYM19647.1 hypothetical protein At15955_46620 [Agrobacterium tumefaciens]AYM70949.1 hypothetical protein AtA6_47330 [Agrobacterium tumefaciens]CUX05694.1 hypothetical protein AGR1C_pAt40023 [Agrobacterium fabacearum TT111]